MKKILAILLCVAIVASLAALSGCSKKNNNPAPTKFADFTESLVAEKVGSIDTANFATCEGGLYYKNDQGLYGVISFNGRYDTGAKYEYCSNKRNYFMVSTKLAKNFDDISGLNRLGIIDGSGKTIVPMAFASFEILNERYIRVYEATKRIYSEDNALFIIYDDSIVTKADADKAFYEGNWRVYDTVKGMFLTGVSGTKKSLVIARGDYVTYNNDNDEKFTVNGDGKAIPEGATIFEDGSYAVEGKIGEVFDTKDKQLFTYDLTGFIPFQVVDGNKYMAKRYMDGATKYVVMDNTGNVISAEFDTSFDVYGEVVLCNGKVTDLQGKTLIAGTFDSLSYDKFFANCWLLRADDTYTMIKNDGSVFFQATDSKEISVFPSDYVAQKKKDNESYYYSHKDKKYNIKGYSFAPWLVKTNNANSLYDVVDTISGETIFEGYSGYTASKGANNSLYIYAKHNAGTDIFQILSTAQIELVKTKKANLLKDLIDAFKKEGINVTVNEETGELALDSSVLFGGDSAELTADGKNFLNKFTRAYTSIIFSKDYNGFISKTLVEGHIAPVAGSTYSSGLGLSEQRANNVKAYCISAESGSYKAEFAKSLISVGYSNSQPVYGSNGKVDMAASRRVSFRFMLDVDAISF